jgi:ectoine hydroxylase-related dioxygenase (phytanoyl-CoA dioxygenase family)
MALPNRLLDLHDEQRTLSQCPRAVVAHVEDLLKTGVTIIRQSLPADLCDEIRNGFIEFATKNEAIFRPYRDEHGHYPRIVNLHTTYKSLFELFRCNVLALAVQDYLFDGETVLYTSLFYERGSSQPPHRDTPYFATRPEYRYLGVWVALEDTDLDNGPLMAVKRGHLIPELDREAIARRFYADLDTIDPSSDQLWNAYQDEVARECQRAGFSSEPICVKKGDTIIWHPQTPHGGAEIRDLTRTRYSLVMHTTPIGVPVYHQNVFFRPSKEFSDKAPWGYVSRNGRRYADFRVISFGHQRPHPLEEFSA